jgi:hypothetical protein
MLLNSAVEPRLHREEAELPEQSLFPYGLDSPNRQALELTFRFCKRSKAVHTVSSNATPRSDIA